MVYEEIEDEDMFFLNKMKALELKPNWIAVSFASNGKQITHVRNVCNNLWNCNNIKIMAKVESRSGIQNLNDIISHADGIMIARGDLLMCIEPYELPFVQASIVKSCREQKKIVCVATEFFDKYAETGIISRSELSDIYLAALQNIDYIMLARETGNSSHVKSTIDIINRIIEHNI